MRKQGIDPETQVRYLEELAFEVVSEQSLRDITIRAEDLTARGVRRLLAIFVKRGEISEWSPSEQRWILLPLDSKLEDPTLARPVEIGPEQRAHLQALDASGLEQLLMKIESERRWP